MLAGASIDDTAGGKVSFGFVCISVKVARAASKLQETIDKYAGISIALEVGTSRLWSTQCDSVLKSCFQTPNGICAWRICKGPRHFATETVSSFACSWMETVTRPRVYVQWGGASELSNYDADLSYAGHEARQDNLLPG